MGKRNQVDVDTVKKRPRRGAASSAHKVLQSPVLNVLADPHFASVCAPPPSQVPDAPVVEVRKALRSTQHNVPHSVRSNDPECNLKTVVKESAEYLSKLQTVQQVCDAIDAEVKSRSASIRALAAAEYSSLMVQLDLQLSKFSTEEQNMPLEEYLRRCPGIKSAIGADGIELEKRSSPYPKLEESKRNLQDTLRKAKDGTSKGTHSLLFTPCAEPKFSATQFYSSEHEKQEAEPKLVGDDLSWPEYYTRLQSWRCNAGVTPSLGNHYKFTTPLIHQGSLMSGITPKTLRLPKQGETMLSINGSPLGKFGKTPGTEGNTRITRTSLRLTKLRLAASKRSLRDL